MNAFSCLPSPSPPFPRRQFLRQGASHPPLARGGQRRRQPNCSQLGRRSPILATLILTLLALGAFSAGEARAASITWTGATNTFNSAGNWSGTNTPPISGDSIIFGAAGAGGLLVNNNLTSGAFNLAGITFNAGASAFVIGNGTTAANAGNAFALTGDIVNNSTSLQTINNPFSITAVRTFTTSAGGGNISLGGNISGTGGGITLTGGGRLTLTGANTFSGGTTIASGTLQIGAGGASGSITGNVTNNGSLVFNRSDDFTFGGVISGSGGLVTDGNILRFSAAQTYTGPTQINTGILVLPTTVDFGLSGSTVVSVAAASFLDLSGRNQKFAGLTGGGSVYSFTSSGSSLTLDVASGQTYAFSGGVGGTYPDFSLIKSGPGTQILSGANTYTGATLISAGTLQIGNNGTTGSLPSAGAITDNATLTFDRTNTVTQGTDFGVIGGSGQVIQQGGGTLILNATNTYTGGTIISNGTLQLGAGGATGSILGNVVNNGTLVFNRSDDYTFNGVVSGAGGLVQNGYILRLATAQTYSGPTQINAGAFLALPTGGDNGLAPSTIVTIAAGGFLDISSGATTFAGLAGGGTLYGFGGSASNTLLTVQPASGQTYTFSGTLGNR